MFSVIFDDVMRLFSFEKKSERRAVESDTTGVATNGPAAGGGPGRFDGTAASCIVPVQHAPPTLRGRMCSIVKPV